MPLKPKTIIMHTRAADSEMARHVQAAFPTAAVEHIKHAKSSWDGTAHSLEPGDFFKEKLNKVAVLYRNPTWKPCPNGRSTDFLPSVKLGTGCGYFCQYCYVERGKPNSYPKMYTDCMQMVDMVDSTLRNLPEWRRRMRQPQPRGAGRDFEMHRDPKHPPYITFDLGCDTDCTLDNQLTRHGAVIDGCVDGVPIASAQHLYGSDFPDMDAYPGHIIELMNQIGEIPGAMTSFATKGAELDPFIADCKYPQKNRIRLSLMPEKHRRVLEMNTATVEQRLEAINKLVAAGFEVHINLSPIVLTKDFDSEYRDLFIAINDTLSDEAKAQLAYEVIFLTHSPCMDEPVRGRRLPAYQMMSEGPYELKVKPHKSKGPRPVTTYSRDDKNIYKTWIKLFLEKYTPYARIRYMF